MRKIKLLIENFLIYGLGGIIGKLIPFIMLPIITRFMPDTSYFGISDLSHLLVSFGSAIALMGMYEAMYRLFFDKEDKDYKIKVCSTALVITVATSSVMCIIVILFREQLAEYIFKNIKYQYLVVISALSILFGASNTIVAAPTRMQNKRKVYLITNLLSPLISYAIVIPLLLNQYYLIALPVATLISYVCMEVIFLFLNRKWFGLRYFDKGEMKNLLRLGVPMMPSFLVYWIFGSCDRIMITYWIGTTGNGVYSVGAKMGSISQLIYIAFMGGWQYFAFLTMHEENQVKTNSKIFEYLGVISFSMALVMCAISKQIFCLLFAGDFQNGYIVAPFLFMSPLLQMLFQVIGNQFLVIKKTGFNALFLTVGAVANIFLNCILIPLMGIEGAALATLTGYIVSLLLSIVVLSIMKRLLISLKFYLSIILTVLYFILWRWKFRDLFILPLMVAVGCMGVMIFLYRNDLAVIINTIKSARKNRVVEEAK